MKRIAIISIITLSAVCSFGQARKMSLSECISAAVESNPALLAEKANVERAKILTGTAFDAPNTSVELSQDATGGGSMENGVTFSQEFDFPTVYVARRKALKADYAAAEGAYNDTFNRLVGDITSAYHAALYAGERVKVLEEISALHEEFVKIAQARYEVGEASRLEAINAQRLKARGDNDLREARLQADNSRLALGNSIGLGEQVVPDETALSVLDIPDLTSQPSPQSTYSGILKELQLKQSERNLSMAKQDFMPGLFISATTQLLIKGFNPYDVERPRFEQGNFMGFKVGLTVPLFFGAKRSRLLAAKKEVEIARLNTEEESARIAREWAEANNEFNTAAKSLDYYESTALRQANEIARLAKVSYELGEIGYIEYIENMQTAADIRLEYLECIDKYNQSIIKLRTIKGIL